MNEINKNNKNVKWNEMKYDLPMTTTHDYAYIQQRTIHQTTNRNTNI